MSNQSIWYLENMNMSDIFCKNKLQQSNQELIEKSYKKGEYIYEANETADKIFLIKTGKVKIISVGESGKEIVKTILSSGDIFGERSIFGQQNYNDAAVAVEDTQVSILSSYQLKSLMKEHSSISLFFMKLMGSKVLEMEQRLESLIFKDSKSRIIEFLLNLIEKKGQRIGYEWVVRNFITHQEIANLTATSRQSVTTLLNELRNEGIITFDRKRLLIRDLEKLKSL
ncbi:MAG: Crp/Fnr family transcriptional regulator [Saprospiraceae bacterium]|nr:Crp/Fnr family transcriptional regulator [Saprospiraceae bacterium]MBK6564336.1 Crp/Fnr family transcriptional regulator [Saprospiraceae bacterium]MBK7523982.1 Crp/Fnr family transcriptional regulator [Saprospiraceae bacterium]MBK8079051.1 Crp/Fnr family transcriptional regulator [Saprospiraceae bacterium]MBK8372034.1 Crp/Fnr family transcriptional regulator [Saprospiraceae bacterium]